jgi:hypothetical protein
MPKSPIADATKIMARLVSLPPEPQKAMPKRPRVAKPKGEKQSPKRKAPKP